MTVQPAMPAGNANEIEALRQRLAALRGIGEAYYDYRGELRRFTAATRDALLAAMGCEVSDEAGLRLAIDALESERWRQLVPPVAVVRPGHMGVALALPSELLDRALAFCVRLEDGGQVRGTVHAGSLAEGERQDVDGRLVSRRLLGLPESLPCGYHALEVELDGHAPAECALIVSPAGCFEPASLRAGARGWGLAVQLYTVRSARNWGIGDFADLRELVAHAARQGADFVGVNPLHALFAANPAHFGPYSPSSRQFLNVLYIAVTDLPEYAECAGLKRDVTSAAFQRELSALRAEPLVDYVGVSRVKLPALERLHEHFRAHHLAARTPRARDFLEYRRSRGEALRRFALHEAIDRRMRMADPGRWGWPVWPRELRDPEHAGVAAFEAAHPVEVEFHAWLQWVAEQQLAAVQRRARELGMGVGLYGDYAVGVNIAGAETWADPQVYRTGAAVGAPPDPLALKGQDWGIPPQDPHALIAARYRPFRALIEANMRHYGALRVDHVMSLFRQWWVPAGFDATDGGYVHYALEDLMSVLALESERNRCLVIGEDLGTVPDEVRHAMAEFAVYHYKVLLFEKETDGRFRAPDRYARRAVAAATTHDLPTLRGYWEGRDLELRDRLGLYPNEEIRRHVHEERTLDRARLLAALADTGLAPAQSTASEGAYDEALLHAVQLYLARSASALVVLQLEDLLGMSDPVNVPGTHAEYPNWQRKLSAGLDEIFADQAVLGLLDQIRHARGKIGKSGSEPDY